MKKRQLCKKDLGLVTICYFYNIYDHEPSTLRLDEDGTLELAERLYFEGNAPGQVLNEHRKLAEHHWRLCLVWVSCG